MSQVEIKVTDEEAKEMDYHSLAAFSRAYAFVSLNENPQEQYKALWDRLAEKYNFDPKRYNYNKESKSFIMTGP